MVRKIAAIFRKKWHRRLLVLAVMFLGLCVGLSYLRTSYDTCSFCGSTRTCRGWPLKLTRVQYEAPAFPSCQHDWQPGVSSAVEHLVSDGSIVLVKKGRAYGAFILHKQEVTSTQIEYDWYYRTDGNGTFRSEDSDSLHAGTAVSDRIRFGPFVIGSSQASAGKGYIYYERFLGCKVGPDDMRICVTREGDIQGIDATDSRWLYKASPTDQESTSGSPLSFRHVYEVVQGQNLNLQLSVGQGLELFGLREARIEGQSKKALVELLRTRVAEALDSPGSRLPRGGGQPSAFLGFPLGVLEIASSSGECEVAVYPDEVSPEFVRGSIQWYRIPCPGIWEILAKANPRDMDAHPNQRIQRAGSR